ncbi:TetR/AcrR family transcriptional regulator [Erythrobacter alti]|uniref:TetR/AcrR family transcriptional regulator n=1 Tax=Erythrobacter alti TaxID=1896145 RepID=UPI0030F4449D
MASDGKEGQSSNAEAMSARRHAILAAADELLAENGLDGLTIRAVLAHTGLARRAFYDVFATKDDLVLALFEKTLADAAEQLEAAGRDLAGPSERLALVIQSIVLAGGEDRELARRDRRSAAFSLEHLRLAQARPDQLQLAIKPLVDLIRRIIDQGIEIGVWQVCDSGRAARFVYNLVSTNVHTEMLQPGSKRLSPAERQSLSEQTIRFCQGALVGTHSD